MARQSEADKVVHHMEVARTERDRWVQGAAEIITTLLRNRSQSARICVCSGVDSITAWKRSSNHILPPVVAADSDIISRAVLYYLLLGHLRTAGGE